MTARVAIVLALLAACGGSSEPASVGAPPASDPEASQPAPRAMETAAPAPAIAIAGTSPTTGRATDDVAVTPPVPAADDADHAADCDRLARHLIDLTEARLPARAGREAIDKLRAQADPVQALCSRGRALSPDYHRCVLASRTLDEALLCNPAGDDGAAAFEQARQLSRDR